MVEQCARLEVIYPCELGVDAYDTGQVILLVLTPAHSVAEALLVEDDIAKLVLLQVLLQVCLVLSRKVDL